MRGVIGAVSEHFSGRWPQQAEPENEEAILITSDMLFSDHEKNAKVDFEQGMSYAPPLMLALVVTNILVFFWELSTNALESREAIIAIGALYRPAVLHGEVWRLISAMFLHASPDHLLGNCIILYIVGMACEHGLGF